MSPVTIGSVEDVLALAPVILGFEPHESIVMLTFGSRTPFHARIDLPPPEGVGSAVATLVAPAVKHGVRGVIVVVFSGRARLARLAAGALRARLHDEGVDVLTVLRADGERWFLPLGPADQASQGVPYDLVAHPLRVGAVLEGRAVAASRTELAERLRADPAAVAAVEAALGVGSEAILDGPELTAVLDRHLRAGSTPGDEEAARILVAARDAEESVHAWARIRRADAAEHVRLWTDLVRRAPAGLVADPAAVLAFAAWKQGDGALAWCAVDRCLEEKPDHVLGRLMARALEEAVPPLGDEDEEDQDGFLAGWAG